MMQALISRTVYTADELLEKNPEGFDRAYEKYLRKLDRETTDDRMDRTCKRTCDAFLEEAKSRNWFYTLSGNYVAVYGKVEDTMQIGRQVTT
jgi:hypothetical protein